MQRRTRSRDHAGVHRRGTTSWEVREDFAVAPLLALYVRDAAGLAPYVVGDPDVGPLQPAPRRVDEVSAAAVREWPIWWHRALTEPVRPDTSDLADLHAVRPLVQRHLRAFSRWHADREREWADEHSRRPPDLTRWINGYEGRLGRPVRPFRLTVRLLPLAEPVGWVLSGDDVLVSTRLQADGAAFRAFLAPVVDAMA